MLSLSRKLQIGSMRKISKHEDGLVVPNRSAINRTFRLIIDSAILAGQFLSIAIRFFHSLFMEILLIALQIFLKLLAFTIILLRLHLFRKFFHFFLMRPFHLHECMIELLFHFLPLLLKSGPHELPFQVHLLNQIFLILIEQPLLVPHHQFQFDYLLLFPQFCTLHLLDNGDTGNKLVLCREVQSFQLVALLPQECHLLPQLIILRPVLFLNKGELPREIRVLLLLAMAQREDLLDLAVYLLERECTELSLLGLFWREERQGVCGVAHFIIKYYV